MRGSSWNPCRPRMTPLSGEAEGRDRVVCALPDFNRTFDRPDLISISFLDGRRILNGLYDT